VLQNRLPGTTDPPGYSPNLTPVLHTPITVSAGEDAGEEGDTRFISRISHSTLPISNAANMLRVRVQPHPLNKRLPRLTLITSNLPLSHPDPKNGLTHAQLSTKVPSHDLASAWLTLNPQPAAPGNLPQFLVDPPSSRVTYTRSLALAHEIWLSSL